MPRHSLDTAVLRGFLSPAQLATLLHTTPPTIRKMCREKKIPYHVKPPSRELLIPAAEAMHALIALGHFASKPPSPTLIQAAKIDLLRIHQQEPDLYATLLPLLAPLLVKAHSYAPAPPLITTRT